MDWDKLVFPKLKKTPPLLLYGYDFELLQINSLESAIEEILEQQAE